MPGPRGDDVRLERQPEQHHVADDIENLVPDELVLKAQRLLGDDLVAANHNGAVQGTPTNFPELQQLLNVLVNREGSRRRDSRFIGLGIDGQRQILGMNAPVVRRRARNLEFVTRQRDDRGVSPRHRNGGVEFIINPFLVLFHRLALMDQIHERPGRAIHHRRLGCVHFHDGIVHPAAVKGAEHVFDRVNLHVTRLDRGRAHHVRDLIDPRAQFRRALQIDSAEDNAGAGGCWLQGQRHAIAGVQRTAFDRDLPREGALFH